MGDTPVEWLVGTVLNLYFWVILIGVVMSWLVSFNVVNTRNQLVGTIYNATERLTEPALRPIRKVIPPLGGIDLSPVVLIIGIGFAQRFLVPLIPF